MCASFRSSPRDQQRRLLAQRHLQHALVPATNDLARSDLGHEIAPPDGAVDSGKAVRGQRSARLIRTRLRLGGRDRPKKRSRRVSRAENSLGALLVVPRVIVEIARVLDRDGVARLRVFGLVSLS